MTPPPLQLTAPPPGPEVDLVVGMILRYGVTVLRIQDIQPGTVEEGRRVIVEHSLDLSRKLFWEYALLGKIGKGDIVIATPETERRASQGDLFQDDDEWLAKLPLDMLTSTQTDLVVSTIKLCGMLRKKGYINLRPSPRLELDFRLAARQLGFEKPPYKLSTLYYWSRRLDAANGDPYAVIRDFTARGGRDIPRTFPRAEAALKSELAELDKPENRNKRIVVSQIRENVRLELTKLAKDAKVALIELPSWSTVDRRCKDHFGAYEIDRRNHGKQHAAAKFSTWVPREKGVAALECIELDDKDSRNYLVDGRTGLPYGRALVTPGVDQGTGYALGWHLSAMNRSTMSAVSAIVDCLLPKDPSDARFSRCSGFLEGYGRPVIAVLDNAKYNHSKNTVQLIVKEVRSAAGHARSYAPRDKTVIEGFNARIEEDFLPTLEGYVGPKKFKDRHQDSKASAILTVEEFEIRFACWVVDRYLNQPTTDGRTPRQKWIEAMSRRKKRVPSDAMQVRLLAFETHDLCFREEGVNFKGLIYSSEELFRLRRFLGASARVYFRLNPGKLEFIFVIDPRHPGRLLKVPSAQPEYVRGLTLFQHELICKLAAEDRIKNPDIEKLVQYRDKLKEMTAQWRVSTKLIERKAAARAGAMAADAKPARATKGTEVVTDLEQSIDELDLVVMEGDEYGWGKH